MFSVVSSQLSVKRDNVTMKPNGRLQNGVDCDTERLLTDNRLLLELITNKGEKSC